MNTPETAMLKSFKSGASRWVSVMVGLLILVAPQVFGQSADAGKLIANAHLAGSNGHADLLRDLSVDRGGRAGADGDANVHLLY